jgi:hypothetical protein
MIDVERVDFVSVPTRDVRRPAGSTARSLGLPASRDAPEEFEAGNVTLALWQRRPRACVRREHGGASRSASTTWRRPGPASRRPGVHFLGPTVDTGVCLMGFLHDPTATS